MELLQVSLCSRLAFADAKMLLQHQQQQQHHPLLGFYW